MKLLELNHISKSFDGLSVLRDVSLSVEKGEIVSVIGPSGSGKSTLLRCATLLEKIDKGELIYKGKKIASPGENGNSIYASKEDIRQAKKIFGMVFQSFNLFPHFSVLQNIIDAPVTVNRENREEAKERAMKLLKQFELDDKADAYPCQLSGGQQQRVSIVRALALDPEIMYFDEPTSALDPELTAGVLKAIKELAREKMTMIIVTHEMNFAKEVSDRIIFMEKGIIQHELSPDDLFDSKYERLNEFIGKIS
ncbi:MAG: amino acid ABC transporter ATP-binding protein [Lachnospiraceae bacterium]|nr:amino acid ABC transporter ATP-binding protein [Lachnospiraceae bacterium]